MHLRRALLLFAIVLGLAAIVTTVSQPPRRAVEPDSGRDSPLPSAPPTAGPRQDRPAPKRIRFSATARRDRAALGAGRPAVVTVRVEQPGQVDVRGLGLTAAADRVTPARFDVLTDRPAGYDVEFTPAGTRDGRRVGTIVVAP